MEQIYVTYGRIPTSDDTRVGYHTALHYLDRNGVDHVIEGGPLVQPQGNQFSNVINEEFHSSSNTDSPWGQIQVGEHIGRIPDQLLPRETLMSGENLLPVWNQAREAMTAIQNEQYEYRPITQNSNTVTSTITNYAHIPEPTGFTDSGQDSNYYLATGMGGTLSNPLSGGTALSLLLRPARPKSISWAIRSDITLLRLMPTARLSRPDTRIRMGSDGTSIPRTQVAAPP